jgi:hypothetical protein
MNQEKEINIGEIILPGGLISLISQYSIVCNLCLYSLSQIKHVALIKTPCNHIFCYDHILWRFQAQDIIMMHQDGHNSILSGERLKSISCPSFSDCNNQFSETDLKLVCDQNTRKFIHSKIHKTSNISQNSSNENLEGEEQIQKNINLK